MSGDLGRGSISSGAISGSALSTPTPPGTLIGRTSAGGKAKLGSPSLALTLHGRTSAGAKGRILVRTIEALYGRTSTGARGIGRSTGPAPLHGHTSAGARGRDYLSDIRVLFGRTASGARGTAVRTEVTLPFYGRSKAGGRGPAALISYQPLMGRAVARGRNLGPLTVVSKLAVSKLNAYVVTQQPPQVEVAASKLNAYAVTIPTQRELSASKVNSYAVTTPIQRNLSVSKLISYAVVFPLVPPPPVFPTLPIGLPVLMTPKFANVYGNIPSGRDMRATEQILPIWEFEINFEELRDQTQNNTPYGPLAGLVQFMELAQLFVAGIGQFGQFLFDAWWDDSRTDQTIGTGNGVSGTFTMVRTWGTGALQFTEPVGAVNVITNVKVAGTPLNPLTDFTISNNNQITFSAPPANGALITSTFSFYYLCQMTESVQDYSEFYKDRWTVKIKFESILQR